MSEKLVLLFQKLVTKKSLQILHYIMPSQGTVVCIHLLSTVPKKNLNNGQKWTNCIGAINFSELHMTVGNLNRIFLWICLLLCSRWWLRFFLTGLPILVSSFLWLEYQLTQIAFLKLQCYMCLLRYNHNTIHTQIGFRYLL